jgi:low affinity Fe/Cu permease
MAAVVLIIVWGVTGPFFHYSDNWQLIINTSTIIVTFLMVFLLQNTQNRDTTAVQLKLDELVRANRDARNGMLCIEDLSEEELRPAGNVPRRWRLPLRPTVTRRVA